MAETLLTVRTEFEARGFTHLGDSRATRLINDAYQWLVKKALWPFREATSSGAAPLTIADMDVIASVVDTANGNQKLHPKDRRELVRRFQDLTTAGTPLYYYIEGGSVVKTYPVGGTLSVRYWKNATALSGDSDPLIVPDSWVQLVIDRAAYRGLLDAENWAGAASIKAEIADALADMMLDQLAQQADENEQIEVWGGENS